MQIELSIKREGGTYVSMPNHRAPDTEYHFAPLGGPNSPHVATVDNEAHARMFLRIPEYSPYGELTVEGEALVSEIADETVPPQEPNANDGEGPGDTPDGDGDGPDEPMTLDQMDRPTLADVHEKLFGEKAHPKAKIDTLRAKIGAAVENDEALAAKFEEIATAIAAAEGL